MSRLRIANCGLQIADCRLIGWDVFCHKGTMGQTVRHAASYFRSPVVSHTLHSGNPQSAIGGIGTVMVAGGGTGGHIFIGISLARQLKQKCTSNEIVFVGTTRGLESRIVPEEGFRLEFIDSAGLKGMGVKALFRNLMFIPLSVVQSWRLIRRYNPNVVVGVGGYSSGPLLLAGWLLRKMTFIVEPNAYPGLTNRILSFLVDQAFLGLPNPGAKFRGKGIVTGIPVREEFRQVPRRERRPGTMTLLIYGGSLGSHPLNHVVCATLPNLRSLGSSLRLIHQTGERDLEMVRRVYLEAGIEGDVRPFLPRIFEEFSVSDLVLCRAGAGTVAELTVAGKASILVPFPGATDDHQTKNAKVLERSGAAKLITQKNMTPGRLTEEIRHLMEHPEELDRMEAAALKLGRPDAAANIADRIVKTAKGIQEA